MVYFFNKFSISLSLTLTLSLSGVVSRWLKHKDGLDVIMKLLSDSETNVAEPRPDGTEWRRT